MYLFISECVSRSLFTRAKEGERDKRMGAQEREREGFEGVWLSVADMIRLH